MHITDCSNISTYFHNTSITIRFKGLLRRYAYPSTKYGVRVQ